MDNRKPCSKCGKNKLREKDFYKSINHPLHADERLTVCKSCVDEMIDGDNSVDNVKKVLKLLDKAFKEDIFTSSIVEVEKRGYKNVIGIYLKNLALNNKDVSRWEDGETEENKKEEKEIIENIVENKKNEEIDSKIDELNNKNRLDVIRMVGFDPFESENENDKTYLYNRLVDFLDESTLEDSFKLPAVIEIVKSFNQIDKINAAISNITSDIQNISSNVGSIKSLSDTKKQILASVLALAKDNGISVNHNNNKSKGAGTLSGIIKQLQEKGIDESEINIYDIETCAGMKQVADISNRSIMEQLMLNENDYTEMIKDQKEMINNYEKKLLDLEEENRLLKIKLKYYEESGS